MIAPTTTIGDNSGEGVMTDLERKMMLQLRTGVLWMPRTTTMREDWIDLSQRLISEYVTEEAREQEGRTGTSR
jgi:hypothetical protein